MGLFDPKATDADLRRAVSRLAGEHMLLQQAVVLLIRHSPDRKQLLIELRQDAASLRASARHADMHPALLAAMADTLAAIERTAGS